VTSVRAKPAGGRITLLGRVGNRRVASVEPTPWRDSSNGALAPDKHDPHMDTHTPAPHRCPAAHCWLPVQVQNPAVHCPVVPHWALVTHVPHVPATQASPPPHWLLAVHAEHLPLMHASPLAVPGPNPPVLQSANVVHAPQTPLMQAWPLGQPGKHCGGEQTPPVHVSPAAQSVLTEQAHCDVVCVAMQVAVGPHWPFAVHT
jgi:hypothetical protein